MKRRTNDPVSLLMSLKKKIAAARPAPLEFIPVEELAAFHALRQVMGRSKLLPYLDKRERTGRGERAVCIDEQILAALYPGLNPLTDPMPEIDSFIYVYEAISGHDIHANGARGDLRRYFSEVGFRQMLLELNHACHVHQFCADNLRSSTVVIEPITRKPTIDARKDALSIHARAREVFHQIGNRIDAEMESGEPDLPRVLTDACRFAREMAAILEPLAAAARQIRREPERSKK